MSSQAIVFLFLGAVVIVPTLAHYWYSIRLKEWEMSLKHAMLERGMSAHEIQMVLRATSGGSKEEEEAEESA